MLAMALRLFDYELGHFLLDACVPFEDRSITG